MVLLCSIVHDVEKTHIGYNNDNIGVWCGAMVVTNV